MDAVIFDCDGVLIDSETIAHEIEMRAVKGLGLDFDPEVYRRKFQGLAVKSWRKFLDEDHRAQLGTPLPDLFIENLCHEISSFSSKFNKILFTYVEKTLKDVLVSSVARATKKNEKM